MTVSEDLFEEFCRTNDVPCVRVPTAEHPTPDYEITLAGVAVVCEVKQIDMNPADRKELDKVQSGGSGVTSRFLPNRLSNVLLKAEQLQAASTEGRPTLLVIYDNTPFKSYTDNKDTAQAMFGRNTVAVAFDADDTPQVSAPYFGGNRRMTPTTNTSVSAVAVLDGGPVSRPLTLRVYHNRFARVRLEPDLLTSLPVTQPILPDTKTVDL